MKTANFPNEFDIRYVILEDGIPYDWDDYDLWGCVMFDLAENKIATTKYGHGSGKNLDGKSIDLDGAINNNIITCEMIIDAMVAQLNLGMPDMYDYAVKFSLDNPMSLPVTVNGGRKFKGNGYLVYALREPVRYGLGAYKNEYHHYPVVFDPVSKTFNKVNSFGYLSYDDSVVEEIKKNIRPNIANTVAEVLRLAHAWAYDMSYSSCDRDNYRYLLESYRRLGMNHMIIPDCVKEGIELHNEQKRVAREALKAEKMPALLAWVAANTDKTGDAAVALAEHIFNKRY